MVGYGITGAGREYLTTLKPGLPGQLEFQLWPIPRQIGFPAVLPPGANGQRAAEIAPRRQPIWATFTTGSWSAAGRRILALARYLDGAHLLIALAASSMTAQDCWNATGGARVLLSAPRGNTSQTRSDLKRRGPNPAPAILIGGGVRFSFPSPALSERCHRSLARCRASRGDYPVLKVPGAPILVPLGRVL